MRRVIDCGFVVGVLELTDDGKPMLTLVQPETDDDAAKSMALWDTEGLETLCDALREYLDAWAERQAAEDRAILARADEDLPQ